MCSRHYRYRDLVECGETWRRLAREASLAGKVFDNSPTDLGSYVGLARLATALLDPLVEEFGRVQLEYGFAGSGLTKHIRNRICPALDQHAASESRPTGSKICDRLGAAVDLMVPGIGSDQLLMWCRANVEFDRIYFYGETRPLHISVGPSRSRIIVEMLEHPNGRRMPRRMKGA